MKMTVFDAHGRIQLTVEDDDPEKLAHFARTLLPEAKVAEQPKRLGKSLWAARHASSNLATLDPEAHRKRWQMFGHRVCTKRRQLALLQTLKERAGEVPIAELASTLGYSSTVEFSGVVGGVRKNTVAIYPGQPDAVIQRHEGGGYSAGPELRRFEVPGIGPEFDELEGET